MPTILIIDDDDALLGLLGKYLGNEGLDCLTASTVEKGLEFLRAGGVDALILDVMLPGTNGFEVLRNLRKDEKTSMLPVLMLTAKDEDIDRIVGLELGADDYLGKPFNPRELLARLRALLRRSGQNRADAPGAGLQQVGDISINRASLWVAVSGKQQPITVSELRLLGHLVDSLGTVVSRDFLCKAIFGHAAYPMDRSLDVLVSRLRKKLGPGPDGRERIKAVRGEGYMYIAPGELS